MYTLVYQTKKTYHHKVREFDISRDNKFLALLSNKSFLVKEMEVIDLSYSGINECSV